MQARADAEQARVVTLQREGAEAVRRAAEEERARIARELHDVVTHNVSVMVIQAGAARTVLETSPGQAREALLSVEASGRAAMTELRHVMGLLTADGETLDLAPQPGMAELESLVGRVRASGLPVELVVTGSPDTPMPDGVVLAGLPRRAGGADERGEARGRLVGDRPRRLRVRPVVDRGDRHRRHAAGRRPTRAAAADWSACASGSRCTAGRSTPARASAVGTGSSAVIPLASAVEVS